MPGLAWSAAGPEQGPLVLFLHGFMGSGRDWEEIISSLTDDYRCCAVDLGGHGGSALRSPEADCSMKANAEGVIGVLEEMRAGKAALVGYSMGGRLAMHLALRQPGRWRCCVLESASPGIEEESARRERLAEDERWAGLLESGDFEAFLDTWYAQPLFSTLRRDGALLRRTRGMRRGGDARQLARAMRGMSVGRQPSLWVDLREIGVPTMAVAGKCDVKYAAAVSRLAELSPLIDPVIVPEAGHNVHLERPALFARALRSFLDSHKG